MFIAAFAQDSGPKKYLESLACSYLKTFDTRSSFDLYVNLYNRSEVANLILTGTSLGDSLEKAMIKFAFENGIPSVSFIDHWSWYRERFDTEDGLLLPDMIIVNDEIAFADAVSDGLPSQRLISLGNPVLEGVSKLVSKSIHDVGNSRAKYQIPENKRVILFVSEDLKFGFPSDGDFNLGYDEYEVIDMLIANLALDDHLAIKLHPSEPENKYKFLKDPRISIIRDANVDTLAALGDVIIGMASMLLLELALIRADVISFRPGGKKTFIGEKLGATLGAGSIDDLNDLIVNKRFVGPGFQQRFTGSKDRIVDFLESMAR